MSTSSAGTSGNDTLSGTDCGEKLVGGGGDDLIDGGGGSDFLNGGGGDDTLIYDEADYKILGGGGIDTLWFLSGGQQLQLSSKAVSGIEILRLDGGNNHVWLSAADIIRVSDNGRMVVIGGAEDKLWFTDTGWQFDGLTADGESQLLSNGGIQLTVSRLVQVDGFSGNAAFSVNGDTTTTEDLHPDTLTITGTVSISDPNAGQELLLGQPVPNGNATGSISTTLLQPWSPGSPAVYQFSYSIANASVQYLAAGGDPLVESFTFTTIDGSTHVIDFSILGSNDAAVIGDPDASSLNEDDDADAEGQLTLSGQIPVADVDSGESAFSGEVLPGVDALGTLTLAADGGYTYAISKAAVQYLGENQSRTDSFKIYALDGTMAVVEFTIHGEDDLVVFGDPTVGSATSVTEDLNIIGTKLRATGSISITEVDQDDPLDFSLEAAEGTLGSLGMTVTGSYNYSVLNDDVQYLTSGQTKEEVFTIHSVDGVTKNLSFMINGADDIAEIGNPTVNAVTEDENVIDGHLKAEGTISIIDPDRNQAGFRTTVIAASGNLGTLSLAEDGSYTYLVPNASVQYLNTGASRQDSFTITAIDGTTQTISFTINGLDDDIVGGTGNDTLAGTTGSDTLRGLNGDDSLSGGEGNDFLFGGDGNDTLVGGAGDDYFDGGAGNDEMRGGAGDDVYVVDTAGDQVIETDGEGTDLVNALISLTLPGHVENLTLMGSNAINGTGNDLDNILLGNSGNNILTGGAGVDYLNGRGGDDTIYGGAGDDFIVSESSQGGEIYGGDGNDRINFQLTPAALTLFGGAGTDTFVLSMIAPSVSGIAIGDFNYLAPVGSGGDVLDLPGVGNFSLRQDPSGQSTEVVSSGNMVVLTLVGVPFSSDLMLDLLQGGHLV